MLLLRRGIQHQNTSNKWLSLLLFLCALYIVPYMLGYANWYAKKVTADILFFVPFMQVLVIGPVVYFYIQSLLQADFKFSKKDWIHFVPGFLYLLYSLVVFVTDKLILEEFYFYADGRDKDLKTWYQLLGLASMLYYLGLSLKKYSAYKKRIYDVVSYADSILFRWIRNFLLAFYTLLIIRIVFFFSNPQWVNFGSHFWYFISFAFIVYYISISGYTEAIKSSSFLLKKVDNTPIIPEREKPMMSAIDVDKWKTQLIALLEQQKVYQNSQLTLSDIAEQLNTNTKTISSVVNGGFDMNFNDFINHYRIEAVKEQLKSGAHHKTTLLGIAFDCGFNSKATFNRAFKKSTSLSPKDYLKTIS
ncbi:helix-turn-helix domain-containing protein [Flavobacteriaceae bacterium S356]|uniref:Helix-turn-helix domain-containing protein n=1 Tax=Asprobacillus argus TaxID=3076534 RepID=A0ABU3LCQ8_9FLAO|nr:helix-turn-helix domain-containing protein [Flavobacteriaceae bacterium S356]